MFIVYIVSELFSKNQQLLTLIITGIEVPLYTPKKEVFGDLSGVSKVCGI